MGSSLKLVKEAPAGSIVGIGGLEELVTKYATLCTTPDCPNFTRLQAISMGLVKVTVETTTG
jgi:ribosome assembly protein 1